MKNIDRINEFTRLRPTYVSFSQKTNELIKELVCQSGISLHTTEFRAKSIESFAEKIKRPGKSYSDPIAQMPDLAGVRVIAYYQEDVEAITSLIRKEFTIAESVDKREELSTDQFGYASMHLVASIGESRRSLPEWSSFSELRFEIQIRTVLQHAWASISHALQYKREEEIPSAFRRKLVRLAGLFELGDEQFSELRKERGKLETELKTKFRNSDFSADLDAVSVEEYLNLSDVPKQILKTANRLGLGTFKRLDQQDVLLESSSLDLPLVASVLGLKTVKELNVELLRCKKRSKTLFNAIKRSGFSKSTVGDDDFWCSMLLVVAHPDTFTTKSMSNYNLWNDDLRLVIQKATKKKTTKKKATKKKTTKK